MTDTKTAATAGPWYVSKEHNGTFVRGAHGGLVASMEAGSQVMRDPDAKLIAAAPEGYETVCCTYLWMLITLPESIRMKAQAQLCSLRNYISKADGRSQQDVQDHFEHEAAIAKAVTP